MNWKSNKGEEISLACFKVARLIIFDRMFVLNHLFYFEICVQPCSMLLLLPDFSHHCDCPNWIHVCLVSPLPLCTGSLVLVWWPHVCFVVLDLPVPCLPCLPESAYSSFDLHCLWIKNLLPCFLLLHVGPLCTGRYNFWSGNTFLHLTLICFGESYIAQYTESNFRPGHNKLLLSASLA